MKKTLKQVLILSVLSSAFMNMAIAKGHVEFTPPKENVLNMNGIPEVKSVQQTSEGFMLS